MSVWYAAYGSNLLRDRFLTYLKGGQVPGTERVQHGARDAADPLDDRPYRLDRVLAFGFNARGWGGGGVAFVDPHRVTPSDTLGRAWRITAEQLADVWAQENGGIVGPNVDLDLLAATGSLRFGERAYQRLEHLGDLDGVPVATITCENVPEPNAAGPQYLTVVGRGLMETWGLSALEAAEYLGARAGNRGRIDEADLATILSFPDPDSSS